MNLLQILILAVVQGAAELLPVSSSAHVIVAEKLMGLDPTAPAMTLLLVMLHTGTMFAVIVYFWKSWRTTYFSSLATFRANAVNVLIATVMTGVVGVILLKVIEHLFFAGASKFEVEHLFGNAKLMAAALAAAGVLILVSSRRKETGGGADISTRSAAWIGAVQGLCLPFRGFSRSGATISTGLAVGVSRRLSEEFSFALAVVLTPAVVAKEAYRAYAAPAALGVRQGAQMAHLLVPSLVGMAASFVVGLLALRLLSRFLEQGRWHFFGIYCLLASGVVLAVG